MAKNWVDIASTEIDAESFVHETLLGKFWDRDESLITIAVDFRWAEVTTTSTSMVQVATALGYIPAAAGTDGGARCTLVVPFEAKASDGSTTASIRLKLGSGGAYQSVTLAAGETAYTKKTVTITADDVNAAKNGEATLYVEVQRTAGGGTVYVRNVWGAARLERAA